MRVLLTGGTGLIGRAVAGELGRAGHELHRLVRHPPETAHDFAWNPAAGTIDPRALDDVDAVIHLAGEPIDHRWTRRRKRAILESRTGGTRVLAEAIAAARRPPAVLVSASAIGFYGDRGDELLDESAQAGDDFLARVCQAWEGATAPAAAAGVRVVTTRFGVVLAAQGGALARQLPFFRAGLGGRLGNGRQWMSCVAIDDVAGAVAHLLSAPVSGPVNIAGAEPVRNAEYTRLLGRLLHRPAIAPVPRIALRLLFGELADVALLASQRVRPAALDRIGLPVPAPHRRRRAPRGTRRRRPRLVFRDAHSAGGRPPLGRPRLRYDRRDRAGGRLQCRGAQRALRPASRCRAPLGRAGGRRARDHPAARAERGSASHRRIGPHRGPAGAAGPPRRRNRPGHSVHLCPGAQHDLPEPGARLGRNARCPRHLHRRQCTGLQRLP